MRHFFLTVLGTIVGIFLFFYVMFFLFAALGASMASKQSGPSSDKVVLTLDLRTPILDHSAGETLFGAAPSSVVNIVQSLNAAKSDNDIKGVLIRANNYGMVPASAEEIRLAIKDFQSSGKFVVTHSQGFEGTSFTAYHAVSASDEIWQQETTGFAVAGIGSETPFYGGVAEKYGAVVQMEQFHEYKNAANVYTQKGFTDAHKEAATGLLTSLYNTATSQIAIDRDKSTEQIIGLFNASPHSAESALQSGLVDKLGHYLEIQDYVKEKAGGDDAIFQSVRSYGHTAGSSGPTIALIAGQGPVVMGKSSDGSNPFSNSLSMGGDSLSEAFEAAAKDDNVKAIIFRVSTPGGSATASDQILNAVKRAQAADKPVIISMGQYAASGGYYVSAYADKIVAMPSTITGSIGVLGGKIALRDTFAKVGYNIEAINIGGEYVGVYSGDEPFTQAQRAAYREQMEDIYVDFTTRVADGRDIPLERVLEIAKGRVWTGEQAIELGLVDELGGFRKAIEVAKAEAGIDENKAVKLKRFPRQNTDLEQLEELFGQSVEAQSDLATLRDLVQMPEVQALLEARQNVKAGQEMRAILPKME